MYLSEPNKLAVALAARAAMQAHREGKPIAFRQSRYPPRKYAKTDADAHAEDVWHVRYDGQDFRDG